MSFGLLSSKECREALEEDPYVPRSRLALAVPFIGKDVPSKSSEFAHPDITIGLTVMAYRYSGLRNDDFNELVDNITSEFTHEIGPARDRQSSIRYEAWVMASGGSIRGLKKDGVDGTGGAGEAAGAAAVSAIEDAEAGSGGGGKKSGAEKESDAADKEVVQLKFLQKSNKEQMQKLRQLWNIEPLVLHYYLNKFIFPAKTKDRSVDRASERASERFSADRQVDRDRQARSRKSMQK